MTIEELRAYKDKKWLLGILTEQVNQDSLKGFDFSKVSVQGGKEGDPTSEIADGQYKIDYINLNEWTTYVVEDLSGADVSKYHYEFNYLPEAVQPFTVTSKD